MIKYEDKKTEKFVSEGGAFVAVPFEVYQCEGKGELIITTFKSCKSIAMHFEEKCFSSPFDSYAENFIMEHLNPLISSWGFDPQKSVVEITEEFSMNFFDKAFDDIIKENTKLVKQDEERAPFCRDSSLEIHAGDAVAIEDGVAVSVASVNDISCDGGALEINVETKKGYERRGCASSCAALLSKHITESGRCVKYVCRKSNAASVKVARKSGFVLEGRRMSFVCYK